MRSSTALVLLYVVFAAWQRGLAALVNVTVDDTDPSILYRPTASWHPNANHCSTCLKPNSSMAHNGTWHDATQLLTTLSNPFHAENSDGDDTGFMDEPATAEIKFIGSAIYVYCIQPLHTSQTNSNPTYMNLTFALDGNVADVYIHNGSKTALGFSPNVNVFTRNDLSETPHILQVKVGPDSVFLFDYMQYTQSIQELPITTTTTRFTKRTSLSITQTVRHHNTETFAGAVGGSAGVLMVFALGLALNLGRRRFLASRRDRQERHQAEMLRENSPMYGPAPFVPRYFPGTVPAAPPPYDPNVPGSHLQLSYSGPVPYAAFPPPISYADLPPPTPPPPLDVSLALSEPPPPFEATTPVVAVLPDELSPLDIPVAANRSSPSPPDTRSEE